MKKRFVALFSAALAASLLAGGPAMAKTPFGQPKSAGIDIGKITRPPVGGPGTTTPKYVTDLGNSSPALKKLDLDSRALYKDQASLIHRVEEVEKFLHTSANRLGLLSTIDADLKKMEAALKAVNSAAEAAEVIPQAREKAKKVKASVSASLKNVTAARVRMDAVVAKTEPIRVKLDNAADKAGKARNALWVINEGAIGNMRFPIAIASGCLKAMPADKRLCASEKVDAKAHDVDTVVLEYDRVVKTLLYTPEPWLPSMHFFDPFSAELGDLDALRVEIERVQHEAEKLASALKELNKVLNREFSFSFPYPNPTWTNPARFSDYKVSISFGTIIKGANAIEREIEHILSSFLWSVLKKLGVKKYVDSLINKANDAVNALLKAVHADVDLGLPDIKAIGAFEASIGKLSAAVDGLRLPEINASLPTYGLPGVETGINFGDIDAAFKFLSPKGVDWNSPSICDGVTYGCK